HFPGLLIPRPTLILHQPPLLFVARPLRPLLVHWLGSPHAAVFPRFFGCSSAQLNLRLSPRRGDCQNASRPLAPLPTHGRSIAGLLFLAGRLPACAQADRSHRASIQGTTCREARLPRSRASSRTRPAR